MSIQRLEKGPRMSQAVVHGGTVYLAGQVCDEGCGPDVFEQTRQTLASIDRLLALAGSSKAKLLSATIFLTDMDTFGDMNRAWEAWVDPAHPPARATVHTARLASAEYRVEIVVVAAV
ncbi:RidA family protein [Ottowia testudinis]|uniref:RidA family protein n=1 Tax=Ottowia testudinis TaxID=2816950 RepID=A0A975H4N4_9BURK|nr:RidA family protein [Ottowia testudinis]QTD46501.1 RidA family protein [Ottowia testudinis]